MKQLDELLKIFEEEIRELISKEENPRCFHLLKYNEREKLAHVLQGIGRENLEVIYDRQIIEVYYNPLKLNNSYLQKSNITDEILVKVFKYLAHHEYGHSMFCESTSYIKNLEERYKDTIFESNEGQKRSDLKDLFGKLFDVLRETYADFQAKKINPDLPKDYLDLKFRAFDPILRINREIINREKIIIDLFKVFYSYILYSSSCFFVFDEWAYLLKKGKEINKKKFLKLLLLINKINVALINRNLDLEGYKDYLIQLTRLLYDIDYDGLIYENNLDRNTVKELESLLASILQKFL